MTNISAMATLFYDGGPLMKRLLPVVLLLGSASAVAELQQYKATDPPERVRISLSLAITKPHFQQATEQ